MIYFATVHWKSDAWIDIQTEMLRKYVDEPYRIYAFLNDIPQDHFRKFDVVLDDPIRQHDKKLDILAERITSDASPDDWLIFIDGDAFPIAPIVPVVYDGLAEHDLMAVQRLENLGEKQPHPCFCATTVRFWKKLNTTWAKGYQWTNALGYPDTDVGGELLGALERENARWLPLLRSNTIDLNPVFFGVYADCIYHHGAGFRKSMSRQIYYEAGLYDVYKRLDAKILNNLVPPSYVDTLRTKLIHPEGRKKRRIHKQLRPLIEYIYAQIRKDPESVKRMFTGIRE